MRWGYITGHSEYKDRSSYPAGTVVEGGQGREGAYRRNHSLILLTAGAVVSAPCVLALMGGPGFSLLNRAIWVSEHREEPSSEATQPRFLGPENTRGFDACREQQTFHPQDAVTALGRAHP
jgi:hypothetical protein